MAKPLISKILTDAGKLKKRDERIEHLRKYSHPALKDVLRINFDNDVVSLLPEGNPPYTADDAPAGHEYQTLYRAFKQFKYYFKGPVGLGLKSVRRESMFINLLESLHHEDAAMLVKAKDKKLKITGITKKLITDTFPDLIKK
jgi:hypothetical protein